MQFAISKPAAKRRRTAVQLPSVFGATDNDGVDDGGGDVPHVTSSSFEVAKDKGSALASGGQFSGALTAFDTALRLFHAEPSGGDGVDDSRRAHREALLHESRAQVFLSLDRDWDAVCAARRATELRPAWGEAWMTLGRAQMNLGEPAMAIESFTAALEGDDQHEEAAEELNSAVQVQAALVEAGADARGAALSAARHAEAARRACGRARGLPE